MNSSHPNARTFTAPLILVVAVVFLAAIACTPAQTQLLEGILQNVDAVNGQITVLTKDGKTVTLTIATQATVQTEGSTSALETLVVGAPLEVSVSGQGQGQVAQSISARQAKIEGVITGIQGSQITVETERGLTRTVQVTNATRIELDDDLPGTLADLRVGTEVEVKFDPDSLVAFKIDTEEERAEIEGAIVGIAGNEVTIETERGRRLSVVLTDSTRIELEEGLPGTRADLKVGLEVEVKFDPSTRTAFRIEVEEEKAEIEGVIVGIVGNEVTIETEQGRRLAVVLTDLTRIELEDDLPGTRADLQVGVEVKAKFDPSTRTAFKIEVEED